MARISALALAVLLALSADAFTVPPTRSNTFLAASTRRFLSAAAVESTSELKRLPESAVEVTIKVPGEATKAAYDKVTIDLSKQISIPGFRKGSKIPPQVLEQAMSAKGGRNGLRVEAINSLLGQLVEPAIKDEHGLEPIGQPVLATPAEELADDFKPGEELELVIRCDVWPDIQWATVEGKDRPYLGLHAKYTRKPFNQERYDVAMNDLKERFATTETAEDGHVLAMGDSCRVNMEGFMANEDGTKGDPLPSAASGDNVEVILGTGRYMEGLVEGLVGGKVGDERTVSVSFPANLRDKTLAGKQAIFDVSILEASYRKLPELTDEFANKVRAGLTVETLEAELLKAVDAEDAKQFTPARNAEIGKALAEVIEVEVPDTLVTNQAREKYAMMMTEMRDNGVDDETIKAQITPENFLKYKDIVKDDIVRDFKVSMACDEIARMEGIEVPDYQVEEQIANIKKDAKEQGDEQDFDENMVRQKVENTLMTQMVFDFLADNAELEVVYKEEEFDEDLMNRLADESLEREQKLADEVAAAAADTETEAEANE